jgi:L-asparaginase
MRVHVFTLGGTIAMAGSAGVGVVQRLTGVDLFAAVPGLEQVGAELIIDDFRAVPSASLTTEDLLGLARRAATAVADDAPDERAGAVVVQGTDTIEETAYLLDLVWPLETPIVMTGAMRNPTLAGPDGPANLLAAVQVAACDGVRGRGCVVVLNDEIHSGRWVRKTNSASTATFASPDTGAIGYVIEGKPKLLVPATERRPLPIPDGPPPPVALYTVTLDDDGGLLDGIEDRYAGLVVAAFGVGHVPSWLAPRLGEIAQRIPVVLASRTGSGPVFRSTYAAVGSESDLLARGLIGAGMTHPFKARILLRLLLANGADRQEIAVAFGA